MKLVEHGRVVSPRRCAVYVDNLRLYNYMFLSGVYEQKNGRRK